MAGFLSTGWSIYLDAGFWVIVSLVAGGLLHTFVPPESFKKWLGGTGFRSIGIATAIGVLLPICSCGVVPLGLTLYWSGASLAATLAFMVATPIINPAAALMACSLLGPELAGIYVVSGFCIPPVIGFSSKYIAPNIQYVSGMLKPDPAHPAIPVSGMPAKAPASCCSGGCGETAPAVHLPIASSLCADGCNCGSAAGFPMAPSISSRMPEQPVSGGCPETANDHGCTCGCSAPASAVSPNPIASCDCCSGIMAPPPPSSEVSLLARIRFALKWGFFDLGIGVARFIFYGVLVATTTFVLLPHHLVSDYLGSPEVLSYGGSVLLGAVIYVCSVGHIPVVAALMAMGANPGVAMTFLLSGVATNLPELISISKLIRFRVALIYAGGLILTAMVVGMAVNALLMPGFTPVYAIDESGTAITLAKNLNIPIPRPLSAACAFFVLVLGLWSTLATFYNRFYKRTAS